MKENLTYWAEGIEKAEEKDNSGALERFSYITDPSARIFYNMAAIYLRQRNINQAETVRTCTQLNYDYTRRFVTVFYPMLQYLTKAIKKDPHMAIGYFLRGAVYLQLERWAQVYACV